MDPHSLINLLTLRWLDLNSYRAVAEHLISTAGMVAIALVVSYFIETTIGVVFQAAKVRHKENKTRLKKVNTLESILRSAARYSIACIALFKILVAVWEVPPESLTVGSAILASAVGFGSQGLIQDVVTGISLLFEEQLRVGDFVEVNGKQGYVVEVGLRVVKLRQLDGAEHIFFNRQITMVTNLHPPDSARSS